MRNNQNENCSTELASCDPAATVDTKKVSSLQFRRIQASRGGVAGSPARSTPAAGGPLRELLAALLLVCKDTCI